MNKNKKIFKNQVFNCIIYTILSFLCIKFLRFTLCNSITILNNSDLSILNSYKINKNLSKYKIHNSELILLNEKYIVYLTIKKITINNIAEIKEYINLLDVDNPSAIIDEFQLSNISKYIDINNFINLSMLYVGDNKIIVYRYVPNECNNFYIKFDDIKLKFKLFNKNLSSIDSTYCYSQSLLQSNNSVLDVLNLGYYFKSNDLIQNYILILWLDKTM